MKKTIETFKKIGAYELGSLKQNEPSCFNSSVQVTKTRITVEEIDEPIEVIHARIKKLWHENINFHHRSPLRKIAEKYGLEL